MSNEYIFVINDDGTVILPSGQLYYKTSAYPGSLKLMYIDHNETIETAKDRPTITINRINKNEDFTEVFNVVKNFLHNNGCRVINTDCRNELYPHWQSSKREANSLSYGSLEWNGKDNWKPYNE